MAERRRVRRAAVVAITFYVIALAVLSTGGVLRRDELVLLAVVPLAIAAILLQVTLSRVRAHELLSRGKRLRVPLIIIAFGAALVGLWWLGTKIGRFAGGVGLAGVCAAYLGIGQWLAEVRADDALALRRGAYVTAGAVGGVALGLGILFGLSAWGIALVVFGVLAAPIGLTLLSEGVLHEKLPWLRLTALASPVLVVAAALWLHEGLGLSSDLTEVMVIVGFVLVGAIASSTQADVLLVVTVWGLFWAATPKGVATDEPRAGGRTLVVLGDSYISGEGALEFYKRTNDAGVNECRRAPTAYPVRVVEAGRADPMGHLAFLACSGAETEDIVSRAQWGGEPPDGPNAQSQLDQLRGLLRDRRIDPGLVVVSIGGNDAKFADIATACVVPGTCVERGQLWLDNLRKVSEDIDGTYAAIRGVVGDEVPVLAVPYPMPISERTCDYSQLGADEHRFLRRFVEQLDRAVRRSARNAGFHYLSDMEGVLEKERLQICDAPREEDIGVNFIRLTSVRGVVDQVLEPYTWLHNSFHPNENGHEAMATVLADWIDAEWPPAKLTPANDGPFVPDGLEKLVGSDAGTYCLDENSPKPKYCDRGDTDWTITKAARALIEATPALLLLVLGWWLWWLPMLDRTRPCFHGGGAWLSRRLFGPGRTSDPLDRRRRS